MADAKTIREWARSNGLTVGERGRLHPDVLAAYAAATGETVAQAPKAPAKAAESAPKPLTAAGEVRAWARSQGLRVGDRGRLHPSILAAYHRFDGGDVPGASETKLAMLATPTDRPAPLKAEGRDDVLAWARSNGFPTAVRVGKKIRAAYADRNVVKLDGTPYEAPESPVEASAAAAPVKDTGPRPCGFCWSFNHDPNVRKPVLVADESRHGYCPGNCTCDHPVHERELALV